MATTTEDTAATNAVRWSAAYTATAYHVFFPEGECVLRVGERSAELEICLSRRKARRLAVITAWNPGSKAQSTVENQSAQNRLKQTLLQAGVTYVEGENRADAGDWPPEPSFGLCGVTVAEASTIAGLFGQNAYLTVAIGHPAELIWLPGNRDDGKNA